MRHSYTFPSTDPQPDAQAMFDALVAELRVLGLRDLTISPDSRAVVGRTPFGAQRSRLRLDRCRFRVLAANESIQVEVRTSDMALALLTTVWAVLITALSCRHWAAWPYAIVLWPIGGGWFGDRLYFHWLLGEVRGRSRELNDAAAARYRWRDSSKTRGPRCPHCAYPLLSPHSRQCLNCHTSWHETSRANGD